MRISPFVATGFAILALPAGALAAGPPASHPTGSDNPGVAHRPSTVTVPALPTQASGATTPGPSSSVSSKAKAYGAYCKGQAKKPVSGTKGTPFSLCVTSMAKIASENTNSPRTACKLLSKKHVKGTKGTPFSLCVSGAAKLKKDLAAAEAPAPAAPETPVV